MFPCSSRSLQWTFCKCLILTVFAFVFEEKRQLLTCVFEDDNDKKKNSYHVTSFANYHVDPPPLSFQLTCVTWFSRTKPIMWALYILHSVYRQVFKTEVGRLWSFLRRPSSLFGSSRAHACANTYAHTYMVTRWISVFYNFILLYHFFLSVLHQELWILWRMNTTQKWVGWGRWF